MAGAPDAYPARPAEASVPILPPLQNRWSPVRFDDGAEVGEAELRTLLESARWAPSSGNGQPTRWVVLRRDDPQRAAAEAALKPGNVWANRASLLLVSVARELSERSGKPNAYAAHDAGMALAHLLAQATALGLATHPMGGFDKEEMTRALGIPEGYAPLVTIAVGYYDPELRDPVLEEKESRARSRKPLQEIAFRGTWGKGIDG